MKKLIYLFTLGLFIFSSVNIFASQLPTDFLATFNTQQNEEQGIEETSDPYSVAFGGNLTTNNVLSYYEDQDLFFDNSETLNFWLKFPLNKTYTSFFAMEGLYDFSVSVSANQEILITNILDIPLFKFAFNVSSEKINSSIDIGRFYFADTTGIIFHQTIDGLFANFALKKTEISFFTGYTGFTNAINTSYFNSPYLNDGKIYALSPKFLLASTRAKFNIFNTQFINAEFFASVDFGKLDYHKMYTTLTLNGAIAQRVFYIIQSTLGMNLKSDGTENLKFSNLSRIDLTTYFDFLASSLSINGIFVSSDGKTLKEFMPITKIDASLIGHTYSSLIKAGILYTIKPTNSLFVSLGSDCICSFYKDSSLVFDGLQWGLETKWQIVSDIYLAMQGEQFISFVEEKPNYFVAGLKIGLSF